MSLESVVIEQQWDFKRDFNLTFWEGSPSLLFVCHKPQKAEKWKHSLSGSTSLLIYAS